MGMSVVTEQNTYLNFINGEWVKSQSGDMVKVENPADVNDIVGYVQNSTAEDVERAVAAANEAKTAWRKLTGAERGQYLYKTADIMERRLEEIAACATREMGKTLPEAKGETARGLPFCAITPERACEKRVTSFRLLTKTRSCLPPVFRSVWSA